MNERVVLYTENAILRIIWEEGCPIHLEELLKRSNITESDLESALDQYRRQGLIHSIGGGNGKLDISLSHYRDYYLAPFRNENDQHVFETLKAYGPLTLSSIAEKSGLSQLSTMKSLNSLESQQKIKFPLGHRLDTTEIVSEGRFSINTDALIQVDK